ncbi:MAG: alpha/beta fold hydrolase [Acidobacteria bacterium]|nr:alpha/beta fold hydrolase [Acidobacteriota bacterium]
MSTPITQKIATTDGHEIAARFYFPDQEAKAVVVIVPAMGVHQEYYGPFAQWLTEQGFLVATFDYRGTGFSRVRPLREVKANIFDWARYDTGAVVEAVFQQANGKPVYWIGHSLGGQIVPFVPRHEQITKVITVGTGSGYWRENAPELRRRVWWLWFFVAPVSMRLFGYFPGKRLRKVGDVPRGVMEQWRRWCLHPEYAVGVEGEAVRKQFAAVNTPIVSLSFEDDEFMSARNTESLHGFYVNAPREMKRFAPADIGEKRIGHFGFFKAKFKQKLWEAVLLPELT